MNFEFTGAVGHSRALWKIWNPPISACWAQPHYYKKMTSKTIIILGVIFHVLVVCTQPRWNSAIIMDAKILRGSFYTQPAYNSGGRFQIFSLLYLNGAARKPGPVIAGAARKHGPVIARDRSASDHFFLERR